MSLRFRTLIIALLIPTVLPACAIAQDSVVRALGTRHYESTPAELERMAGGKDKLVSRLLELRLDDRTPFVAIRAQHVLLNYADNPDVQAALAEDIAAPNRTGLARVVALNIDSIPSAKARANLSEKILTRTKSDASFSRYSRALLESKDAEVSRMAREAGK